MIIDINTYDDFSPANPINQKGIRLFEDVDLVIQDFLSSADFEIYEEEFVKKDREINSLKTKLKNAKITLDKVKAYMEKEDHPFPKNADDIFELNQMQKELKNLLNIK